jgi:hypothetical protein
MRIRTQKKTHEVTVTRGADSAVFEVMPMDPAENDKLMKKHTKSKFKMGQVTEKTDWTGLTIEKIQKVIVEWDLQDESGNLLECNDENKKTAYLLNADIINEVMEKAGEIASGQDGVDEAEIKN